MSRRSTGLMVEAALLLEHDGVAAAMHATLAPQGYALKPLASARLRRPGLLHATLVWRCRAAGASIAMNITLLVKALR